LQLTFIIQTTVGVVVAIFQYRVDWTLKVVDIIAIGKVRLLELRLTPVTHTYNPTDR